MNPQLVGVLIGPGIVTVAACVIVFLWPVAALVATGAVTILAGFALLILLLHGSADNVAVIGNAGGIIGAGVTLIAAAGVVRAVLKALRPRGFPQPEQ